MLELAEAVISIVVTACLIAVVVIFLSWRQNFAVLLSQTNGVKQVFDKRITEIKTQEELSYSENFAENTPTSVVETDQNTRPRKKRPWKRNWAQKGLAFLENGDYDAAIDAFSKAVGANEKDFDCLCGRSRAFFKKFETLCSSESTLELASQFLLLSLQDADACITLNPNREEGYLCKVTVLLGINETKEASAVCSEGMRQIPQSSLLQRMKEKVRRAQSPAGQLEHLMKQKQVDIQEASEYKSSLISTSEHNHSHRSNRSHDYSMCSFDHTGTHSDHCVDTRHDSQTANCATCGSTDRLKACGRCKSVLYCSRECQKRDLQAHKNSCKIKATSSS